MLKTNLLHARLGGLVGIVALAGAAAAVLPARAADMSPELKALVAAAAKEGAVNLTWSASTLDGARGAEKIEAAMNKMFGTHLKLRFTAGPPMPAVGNKLAMEFAAKQEAHADVWIGPSSAVGSLQSRHMFVSAPWTKYLPGRITPDMVEAGGTSIQFVTIIPAVSYNTKLVPYKPTKLVDFLKPEWKGKFASTPYAANFDIIAGIWGVDRMLDFARKLSQQIGGLMRCDATPLATGEFVALVTDCNYQTVLAEKDKGAPLDFMIPEDYTALSYFYLQVPKNAAHPNAGQLFVTFMMTEEGQKLAWDTWRSAQHKFEGTYTNKLVKKLRQRPNTTITEVDIAWHAKHPEATKALHEARKILARK